MLIGTSPKLTGFGLADAWLTPLPLSLNGMPIQVPPTTGHSNTFVVPVFGPTAVGVYRSVTVHVPGPGEPAARPAGAEVERERRIQPRPGRNLRPVARVDVIVTGADTVVLIGTLPKLTGFGLADAVLTPLPLSLNGIPIQVPPTTGHSNTFVVPLFGPTAVGVYRSVTVHVPGPVNPPPVPHVPKSKANGAFNPEPDATSVLYPASTVNRHRRRHRRIDRDVAEAHRIRTRRRLCSRHCRSR